MFCLCLRQTSLVSWVYPRKTDTNQETFVSIISMTRTEMQILSSMKQSTEISLYEVADLEYTEENYTIVLCLACS